MSENFRASGRPMTQSLAEALDSLPNRRLAAVAFRQMAAENGPRARLWAALAVELDGVQFREDEVLRGHLLDRQADIDALDPHPWPGPPAGKAVLFDPDTGTCRPLPGDARDDATDTGGCGPASDDADQNRPDQA